jgi:hypothetical protein
MLTDEQIQNLNKLEELQTELEKIQNLFNKAGYKASIQEIYTIDRIALIATSCQKLARL